MKIVTKITLILSMFIIIFGVQSCFKSEEFDVVPRIYDASYSLYADTAIISFKFEDGDADLGLSPSDTIGVFADTSYYYNNIYLTPYEKDDALGWVQKKDIFGDPFVIPYRIKPISVSGNTQGIKGTIDIMVFNYMAPDTSQADTMKYQILLIDRALNQSNLIETPEIISQ